MFCFLIFTHLFLCIEAGEREKRERDVGSGGQKRGERKERRERENREEGDIVLRNKFDHSLPDPTVKVYPKFKINVSRVKLGL